jgi:proteic killer suppression protein
LEFKFKTKHLKKCYEEHQRAVREFGEDVARKYIQRINLIGSTPDFDQLKSLPGLRCHALTGNRQGQYAINLNGFYRLIFTLEGEELQIVRIEEVSKHYDD